VATPIVNVPLPSIQLSQVEFGYVPGRPVLKLEHLKIDRDERVFLFGPSGCGKTTLLGLIAGVLQPNKGTVEVLSTDLGTLSSGKRDEFRGNHIGYVFQLFNLIPYLNVRDNILLPIRFHAQRRARLRASAHEEAFHLAKHLGIDGLLDRPVTDLSVGQQQRVAAARSLIGSPELVIADEPTSSLDFDHREKFLELLFQSVKESKSTLLFVSHDRSLMPLFDRVLSLPELNLASGGTR
jgi:putative ABC transport system ATP-binding protein